MMAPDPFISSFPYCSLNKGNKTEQNRTNRYSTKMNTICGKEHIQHDLTNCLDPSLRLNRYQGDPGNNELICISYGNQWKTKDRQHWQPYRIGCTTSCQKDNIPSHQKRDDPVPSVINNATWLDSWERMNASI